jgi:hypothetical protein
MPGTLTYNFETDFDADKRGSIIRAIGRSGKIIVMCGAGISTAVGIPVCVIVLRLAESPSAGGCSDASTCARVLAWLTWLGGR